ncbi:tRNA modification GTPase [Lachnospiraceae bacterium XBB1006]|nr:tRNA modification GTPase [Lachnospiraceae bacterium XBB1006]
MGIIMEYKTIAAIATAVSPSGVGIIRLSGPDSFVIIRKIFKKRNGAAIFNEKIESHIVTHGYIMDDNDIIDEVLVITMRAPHTYTGEDTVEIDCHGGVLVMKKILETVIKYGASIAEPGEFSKRAFLNGKMDLSQAESVIDLIHSSNEFARKNSLKQLSGFVKDKIVKIRSEILHEVAFIESALDDPEHYSLDTYPAELELKVQEFINKINLLLKNADNGKIMKEGIQTVIVGKPNVGKSSFLNALLGEDRAIVTDIAGTTRDALSESISLDGITLNIVDTAGIRSTNDEVEKIGVLKSKEYLQNADLVLFLVDATSGFSSDDEEIFSLLNNKNTIVLLNKMDLSEVITKEDLEAKLHKPVVCISAKNQEGLPEFISLVKEIFFKGELSFNQEVFITSARQKDCLISCKDSLNQVLHSIALGMPEDFFSIDLMNAYTELGNITGESVGEDLVNEIFSKFCMGK